MMDAVTNQPAEVAANRESPFSRRMFQVLLQLAQQYRRQFLLVTLFSFLYTALDLLQPLIYRRAINDVAGLFVNQAGPLASDVGRGLADAAGRDFSTAARIGRADVRDRVGFLLLLFARRLYGARVASRMESKLIVNTFGHVLRLPLTFFSRQASAGLAKRIDQCDQVAPVVQAFSQQIAPEAIRLVGICAIMLTQNWKMSLVSVCLLPPYAWIARRMRIAHADQSRSLLRAVGKHLRAHCRCHWRREDREAFRRGSTRGGTTADESHHAYDVYLEPHPDVAPLLHFAERAQQFQQGPGPGYGGWLVLRQKLDAWRRSDVRRISGPSVFADRFAERARRELAE